MATIGDYKIVAGKRGLFYLLDNKVYCVYSISKKISGGYYVLSIL